MSTAAAHNDSDSVEARFVQTRFLGRGGFGEVW
jgi:hypothetical protein